jgi:hypothetical protein
MRRMLIVALVSGLVLAGGSPAFAQRGGHAGGGFGGGGHFGGGFGGGHSFGGISSGSFGRTYSGGLGSSFRSGSFGSAPRFTSTAPAHAITPFGQFSGAWRGNGRWGNGYRSPYRGFYGVPWVNSWELLPWDLGYPDFTGYGNWDSGGDPPQQTQAQSVPPQDDGYRPEYGDPGYESPEYQGAPPATPVTPEPQLTLIFNDGHRETIRNYALTRDSVIVMDRAAAGYEQKIPLSSLNLPATEQAAQQSGLDFTPPA